LLLPKQSWTPFKSRRIAAIAVGHSIQLRFAAEEINSMTTKLFSELGLSEEVLKAIDKLGFEKASPIQAAAIPVLMEGRDAVGQSQTGSGKTAAFGIPAIEKTDANLRAVQTLILCPTRELAVQVSEEIHKLALFRKGIHALPIYGGQSYERQFWGLKQGAHIVIGTPGRVMDHMRRGTLRLDTVKMVVLDEADVMLNMGFRDDIELILQSVPKERQTVFFSATMPKPIRDLIEKFARDPVTVKVDQKAMTVPTVEQVYYEVDRRFKVELLTRLIDIHDYKLGIVFCNTKRMVDDLVDHLNAQGYSADRLHGDMTQGMRDRVMNKFRKSGLEFLVATDVAARGIDVDDVQVVFNYDLPYDPEDYLHRIGRTGRAGRSGRAVSFVAGRELFQIQQIERFTKTRVHRAKIPTADEVEQARATVFLDKLRATLASGEFVRQDHLIETLLEEGFTATDIASALIHHLQTSEGAATAARTAPEETRPRADDRDPRERGWERRDDRTERPGRQHQPREFPPRERRSGGESRFVVKRREREREDSSPAPVGKFSKRPELRRAEIVAPSASQSSPSAPKESSANLAIQSIGAASAPVRKEHSPQSAPAGSAAPVKQSRSTPADKTRLFMNIGSEMGVVPRDIVGVIMGETGLAPGVVGTIDVRERHLFADVAAEHAQAIIAKLNRTRIKDQRVKVKVA
jgi:ATP-dependent RNA helicase DeaD